MNKEDKDFFLSVQKGQKLLLEKYFETGDLELATLAIQKSRFITYFLEKEVQSESSSRNKTGGIFKDFAEIPQSFIDNQ